MCLLYLSVTLVYLLISFSNQAIFSQSGALCLTISVLVNSLGVFLVLTSSANANSMLILVPIEDNCMLITFKLV